MKLVSFVTTEENPKRILRFVESGLRDYEDKKWHSEKPACFGSEDTEPVELEATFIAQMIFVGGFLLSVMCFIIEIAVAKKMKIRCIYVGNARMGSMCCKKLESPYSPKLPDFNKLFLTCTDQIQICRKTLWEEDDPEPKQRKFSASDISYPLPLGCTILPPKRPPRKKRILLERTTSVRVKSLPQLRSELKRSKSIHEIKVSRTRLEPIVEAASEIQSRVGAAPDSPNTDEIVINVIRAAGGPSVPLDSPTDEPERGTSAPDEQEETPPLYSPVEQFSYHRPYFSEFSTHNLLPLEPIMESAYESLESTSSVSLVAENKKHFLATLLEENNNNPSNNMPSRKSSITESLREFECSLYDMLEQESTKEEVVEDLKWRPQIPV
ncbi:hypothetical protein GE061_004367 [Apolygus lucorum]|uniref:Uncharacterized protein n=1 Tax=Apolygus lucorum TaxID=248454 RepID=A0A8S9X0W8_APOLU|nr:hypothetical protein GE061_004367 [Apolygus lucorum]